MSTNLAIGIATGYAIGASANAGPMSVDAGKATAIFMAGTVIAFVVGGLISYFGVRRMKRFADKADYMKPDFFMGGLLGTMIFIGAVIVAAGVAAVLS